MTIFGPAWSALELEHIRAFLDDADDEPLLWEAKGTRLDPREVCLQVCGFANSHEGGYLILGASKAKGDSEWKLDGFKFPDEPRTWISNVLTDPERGVRPMPRFDVKPWKARAGHIAVVSVWPTSTPPCLTNGTIYERLPGKTQTVREPLRLAALFAGGDAAHRAAQSRADRAARNALGAWDPDPEPTLDLERLNAPSYLRFAVGVAATGNPRNIAGRLFSREFVEHIWTRLRDQPAHVPAPFRAIPNPVDFSQDALLCRHDVRGPLNHVTVARASWDGAAAVGQRLEADDAYPDSLIKSRVLPSWQLADEFIGRLGGYGSVYVTVMVAGRRFLRRDDDEPVTMRRGPLAPGPDDEHVASLGRELMRAIGNPETEPPDA